jgi:CubicO group peptidase (beta-lactamase class C family)
LSDRWVEMATTPCPLNPSYGYLWRLDAGCFYARGGGWNVIWIDPQRDLVVVARWVDDIEALVARANGAAAA